MKKTIYIFMMIYASVSSQTVVPVGSGSYASQPPASENTAAFENRTINVPVGNTKPIPTNDWWSQLLITDFPLKLHAYPLILGPRNYGFDLTFPMNWAGQDLEENSPIRVRATNFNPLHNIAKDWNDWAVMINLQDGAKKMDVTTGNGFPMAWFETSGITPYIEFGAGATFFRLDGTAATFPYTSNCVGVLYGGKYYGIYAPDNTQFTRTGNTLTIGNSTGNSYFTVATLKATADLSYFNTFAYSIPRDTKVSYNYSPTTAKIDVTYTVTAQNLRGANETRVLQGFIPHHYKNCVQDFTFTDKEYNSPRGLLKCAVGNSFRFTYNFKGVLANTPAPTVQAIPNPYDPAKMTTMLNSFAINGTYGEDTYAGGKDLTNFSKYTLMAKELDNPNYNTIRTKAKNALIDWLTYTPGETAHYFARYDKWKALIGFNPSYGSQEFTDNHFHYGYLIHAAALLGMVDQDFLTNYGPMLTLVAKQYANWDRNDQNFPYMRTFSIWRGHSLASGTSGPTGANQESSSEAMQSWAGLFFLGDAMGNTAMRDAGAFGYLTESRATREYWFDVDNENLPPTYNHNMVGIVWDGGVQYGTWFSGDSAYIHGIQWLPYSPAMDYLAEYPAYLEADFNVMRSEMIAAYPNTRNDEATFGDNSGWGNVYLSFQQIYNPARTASRFDEYWAAPVGSVRNNVTRDVTAGQTYYYTHSHRTLGDIQFNYHTSAPNSCVYYNPSTNQYTYTGYNANPNTTNVVVYNNGIAQGTILVPGHSFFNTQTLSTLSTAENTYLSNQVTIYPNPVKSNINITSNIDLSNAEIAIYNVLGSKLASEKAAILDNNPYTLSLDKLAQGTYFIEINVKEGRIVKSIIKQ